MGKIKRMDQIKNILRTYQSTESIKATASTLKVSKNTVRHYLRLATTYNADLEIVLGLADEPLRQILYPDKAGAVADRKLIFEGQGRLLDQGATAASCNQAGTLRGI
jgi:hypothetical protein